MSRLGDKCFVNGKDAYETYQADVIGYQEVSGDVSSSYSEYFRGAEILLYNQKIGKKGLNISFYVDGETLERAERNISLLIAEMRKCSICFPEVTGYIYDCVMTSYETQYADVDCLYLVNASFTVVKHLPKVTVDKNTAGAISGKTLTFYNPGTADSALSISFKISEPVADVLHTITVNGAALTYKDTGSSDAIVIDSEKYEVCQEKINIFKSIDLYDFPIAVPGKNRIVFSDGIDLDSVSVSFFPVFL